MSRHQEASTQCMQGYLPDSCLCGTSATGPDLAVGSRHIPVIAAAPKQALMSKTSGAEGARLGCPVRETDCHKRKVPWTLGCQCVEKCILPAQRARVLESRVDIRRPQRFAACHFDSCTQVLRHASSLRARFATRDARYPTHRAYPPTKSGIQ